MRKIGLRNIKTAISVMVCVLLSAVMEAVLGFLRDEGSVLYRILDVFVSRNMLVYACIAAVVVMCSDMSLSIKSGRDRIIGTVFGGAAGIAFIFLRESFLQFNTLVLPLGVIIIIYLLTVVRKEELITVVLTVFFITLLSGKGEPHIYVISKIIATVMGTAVSLLINLLIRPKGAKYEKEG